MVDPIPSPTLFPSYPNKILLNHHFSWLNHHVHPFSYDFPVVFLRFSHGQVPLSLDATALGLLLQRRHGHHGRVACEELRAGQNGHEETEG